MLQRLVQSSDILLGSNLWSHNSTRSVGPSSFNLTYLMLQRLVQSSSFNLAYLMQLTILHGLLDQVVS
jgi:hypothetical protein